MDNANAGAGAVSQRLYQVAGVTLLAAAVTLHSAAVPALGKVRLMTLVETPNSGGHTVVGGTGQSRRVETREAVA